MVVKIADLARDLDLDIEMVKQAARLLQMEISYNRYFPELPDSEAERMKGWFAQEGPECLINELRKLERCNLDWEDAMLLNDAVQDDAKNKLDSWVLVDVAATFEWMLGEMSWGFGDSLGASIEGAFRDGFISELMCKSLFHASKTRNDIVHRRSRGVVPEQEIKDAIEEFILGIVYLARASQDLSVFAELEERNPALFEMVERIVI